MSQKKSFKSIQLAEDPSELIAIKVKGKMTQEDMAYFINKLKVINEEGKKAIVYLDLINYEGFELGLVKEKLLHMSELWNGISKMAYVIDANWMLKIVGLIDAITPMHFRAFGHNQEQEAKRWILSNED